MIPCFKTVDNIINVYPVTFSFQGHLILKLRKLPWALPSHSGFSKWRPSSSRPLSRTRLNMLPSTVVSAAQVLPRELYQISRRFDQKFSTYFVENLVLVVPGKSDQWQQEIGLKTGQAGRYRLSVKRKEL